LEISETGKDMIERILDMSKQYPEAILKKLSVPMPKSGYLVKKYEIESLPANKKVALDKHGIDNYMPIVGSHMDSRSTYGYNTFMEHEVSKTASPIYGRVLHRLRLSYEGVSIGS